MNTLRKKHEKAVVIDKEFNPENSKYEKLYNDYTSINEKIYER